VDKQALPAIDKEDYSALIGRHSLSLIRRYSSSLIRRDSLSLMEVLLIIDKKVLPSLISKHSPYSPLKFAMRHALKVQSLLGRLV
jgi:hypothetical protein